MEIFSCMQMRIRIHLVIFERTALETWCLSDLLLQIFERTVVSAFQKTSHAANIISSFPCSERTQSHLFHLQRNPWFFFFLLLTIRAISGSQQNWLETTEFPSTAYPIYTQCPSPLTFSPEWYIGCNPVNIDASLSPKASRPHLGSFLELYTLCVGFDKCKMTCISCYSIQQNKFTVSKILLHSCYSSLKPLATADLLNSFASSRMS